MSDSGKISMDNGFFHTINCVDVLIDGPGDTTVRPIRPSLLEHAKAERAKLFGGTLESSPTPEMDSFSADIT